ncbi:MAG: DNA adenine methylase [Salinivirgaceae bacterium]|jgi:DNA adenine methylase
MRTPITYYGGKQKMAKRIVGIIPPHKIYCEPYFGGGAVFFEKEPSYLEVINDNNQKLINFFLQMRDNFEELQELIETTLHSEFLYRKAKDIYCGRIEFTDVQLAWSVWITTNMSFSGSIHGGWKWCNGTAGSHSGRYMNGRKIEFQLLNNRLKNIQISSREALRVIKDRDTKETVFYLDPPYPGFYQGHYKGFTMLDFFRLLEFISDIKGKFILSNYWSQTLKYFILKNNWKFESHKINIKVANRIKNNYRTEILVYNFVPERNNKEYQLHLEYKN